MSYLKNVTKGFAVLVAAPVVASTFGLALTSPVAVLADSSFDTAFSGRVSSFSAQALVTEDGDTTKITLEILDQQLEYDGDLVAELRVGEPGSAYANEDNDGVDEVGELIKVFTKKSSTMFETTIDSDDADDLFVFNNGDVEFADKIHVNFYVNDIDELEDADNDSVACDFDDSNLLLDDDILDFAASTNADCGNILNRIRLASGGFVEAERDELPSEVDFESRIFGTSALGYDTNGLVALDGLNMVREDKIEIDEAGNDIEITITADYEEKRFDELAQDEKIELRVGYLRDGNAREDIDNDTDAGDVGSLVLELEPFDADGVSETTLTNFDFDDIEGLDSDEKHTIFVFRGDVDSENVDDDTDKDDVIYQYQIRDDEAVVAASTNSEVTFDFDVDGDGNKTDVNISGKEANMVGIYNDEESADDEVSANIMMPYTFEAMGVATFSDEGGDTSITLKNEDGLLFLDDIKLDLDADGTVETTGGETAFQVSQLKTFGTGANTFRLGTFQEGPDDEDVLGEINEVEIDEDDLDFNDLDNADLLVYVDPNLLPANFGNDAYGNRVQDSSFNSSTDKLISLTVVGEDRPTTGGNGDSTFSDVAAGSTFESFITNLAKDGVVSGFSDGTFKPSNTITRGELAKITKNALFGTTFVDTSCTGFSDVTPSTAFYSEITSLKCQGVIGGFSDGTFKLSNNASRGEATKIVIGAAEKAKKNTNLFPIDNNLADFADVPESNSFYSFIMKAYSNEIVSGTGNNNFSPNGTTTRGEMAKIVDNTRKM